MSRTRSNQREFELPELSGVLIRAMNRANETEVGLVIVVLATIAVGLLYLYLGGAIHAG